ncbi:MAG: TIGR04211 family SH3 domain-containing protein [Salinisphaera sp.]|nr:TIGR04211 family SH3 domain-containing protein [Salinisphaera sp.]
MSARILCVLACALVVASASAAAAPRYISDALSVNMRRGPGTQYRIEDLVKAGTRVDVLKRSDGWSQVRTSGGQQGWVLTRLLSKDPAAQDQLAAMRTQVAELEQNNAALKKELGQALGGNDKLGQLKKKLVAENEQFKTKLAQIKRVSADAIRIQEENEDFRQRILKMETELEQLRYENQSLRSRRDGMKVGAVILIVGIILGLLLPLFRRRSRNNWESL